MAQSISALHNHIVQFYEKDSYVCDVVGRYLAEGLRAGHSVIVIVTPQHRQMISARLLAEGVVAEAAALRGQITFRDARETLATFMLGDRPDFSRFTQTIGGLIEDIRNRRPGMAIRAFGEMVDLLWRDCNPNAAKELEILWNQLGAVHRFALLCAYNMGNFHRESHAAHFAAICNQHGFVLPTEQYLDLEQEDARLREITRLQQRAEALESALEESRNANQLKDEFLALVSHELRTPLNAILGWNRLAESSGDPAIVQKSFEVIQRNAQAQLHLIEDLLDVSRIVTGKLLVKSLQVDLQEVLNTAVSSVKTATDAKGITIDLQVDQLTRVAVTGDRDRLHQVMWNLLSNAVKFTPSRGRVEVRAERVNSHAQIAVSDTGIGIAPEFLPHVFERFRQAAPGTTREHGGLGLGLSLVRHLVEAHGGTVQVNSPGVGRGATFTVHLPIADAASSVAS